jgi:hypothetical protein
MIRAQLDLLQDPQAIPKLVARAKLDPLAHVAVNMQATRASTSLIAAINLELRLRGLDNLAPAEEDDAPDFSLARRIAEDPAATDLAIALLDRIARPLGERQLQERALTELTFCRSATSAGERKGGRGARAALAGGLP